MEGRAREGLKGEEDKTWKTSGERQRRSGKGRSREGLQGWEESSEATLSAHSLHPHTQGARVCYVLIFHLCLGDYLLSLQIWPLQLLLVSEHHQRPFLGLLTHNTRLSNTGSHFINPLSLSNIASFSLIHSLSFPPLPPSQL